jgi:calcium-dependent protein kinase
MISKSSFIGQYIADFNSQYKKIKEIGSGTYGRVYLVENLETSQQYACKIITKLKVKNIERFKTELNLMKITDHPHIVKLFEIWEDKICIYMVMEELKGGEFFERLASRAKNYNMYTESEAAHIFKQLMGALNYLHKHGVCHRDIKPENLIFESKEEDANLKIIDFGLSKIFEGSRNRMDSVIGTTYYIAPEVMRGNYDERCDVWSAGVILYIMLSGRPPFYGKSDNEVLKKIEKKEFYLDDPEWSNISENVKDLLKKIFVDQNVRLNSSEVLSHPWFNNLIPTMNLKLDWSHMLKYSHLDKMTKYVISFLGFRMHSEQIKSLIDIFKQIDINSDGVLRINQLKQSLQVAREENKLMISDTEYDQLFKDLDLDFNGLISYNEFISATLEYNKKFKKEQIYLVFKNLDDNSNGKVTLEEIVNHIRPKTQEDFDYLKKLFDSFDQNSDEEVDFNEFLDGLDSFYDESK